MSPSAATKSYTDTFAEGELEAHWHFMYTENGGPGIGFELFLLKPKRVSVVVGRVDIVNSVVSLKDQGSSEAVGLSVDLTVTLKADTCMVHAEVEATQLGVKRVDCRGAFSYGNNGRVPLIPEEFPWVEGELSADDLQSRLDDSTQKISGMPSDAEFHHDASSDTRIRRFLTFIGRKSLLDEMPKRASELETKFFEGLTTEQSSRQPGCLLYSFGLGGSFGAVLGMAGSVVIFFTRDRNGKFMWGFAESVGAVAGWTFGGDVGIIPLALTWSTYKLRNKSAYENFVGFSWGWVYAAYAPLIYTGGEVAVFFAGDPADRDPPSGFSVQCGLGVPGVSVTVGYYTTWAQVQSPDADSGS
jgi:hypothetical protein